MCKLGGFKPICWNICEHWSLFLLMPSFRTSHSVSGTLPSSSYNSRHLLNEETKLFLQLTDEKIPLTKPWYQLSKLFVVQVYALCLFLQHLVTAMLSYIFLNHRVRAKLEWFIYSDCLIWPHYICQFFLGVYYETDELYFFLKYWDTN